LQLTVAFTGAPTLRPEFIGLQIYKQDKTKTFSTSLPPPLLD
jgi:hypothetical protein